MSWLPRMRSALRAASRIALLCIFGVVGGVSVVSAQVPTLALSSVEVYPGQSGIPLELTVSHVGSIEGIEIGLAASDSSLTIEDVILTGGVLEGLDLEFSSVQIDATGGTAAISWILDSTVPFTTFLAPGADQLLGAVLCSVDDDLAVGETLFLDFIDGVGAPPITNTVHSSAIALSPQTVAGQLQHFSGHHLALATTPALPGATDHLVDVILNNPVNVAGFSLAITYDATRMTCTEFGVLDTITELSDPEFVEEIIDVVPGQAIIGVLLDVIPPYDQQTIPASGLPLPVAKMFFSIDEQITVDTHVPIRFTDGIGTPAIENVVVVGGASILPATVDTYLRIDGVAQFIRGDADRNRRLDLADVINNVFYVTNQCPECPPILCMAALDANDDGRVDIADGVWTANYLFLQGPPPPAPFPQIGPDPTPDTLTCEKY